MHLSNIRFPKKRFSVGLKDVFLLRNRMVELEIGRMRCGMETYRYSCWAFS